MLWTRSRRRVHVVALWALVCLGSDVAYHAVHGPAAEIFAPASIAHAWTGADQGSRHDTTHHPDHCFCATVAADVAAREVLAAPVVSTPLAESPGPAGPMNVPPPLDHPPQLAD